MRYAARLGRVLAARSRRPHVNSYAQLHTSHVFRGDKHDGPQSFSHAHFGNEGGSGDAQETESAAKATEHAVISMFDLFSIGIGPSSSHTVGPMRAGAIFVSDLRDKGLLSSVARMKLALYGSLAATGKGHMTPQALLLGLEGADCETVDTEAVPTRYKSIVESKSIILGRDTATQWPAQKIAFDYDRDLEWMWGQTLPAHSNGMRMSVFDKNGDLLATNDFYSIGGGFVLNGATAIADKPGPIPARELRDAAQDDDVAAEELADAAPSEAQRALQATPDAPQEHPIDSLENVFYKSIRRSDAEGERREGFSNAASAPQPLLGSAGASQDATAEPSGPQDPPFPFHNMASLMAISRKHNLTIAQIVYENELTWASADEVHAKIMRIWGVMDEGIRAGVHSEKERLPGSLRMKRRAPGLYARLMRGLYVGPRRLGNQPDGDASSAPAEVRVDAAPQDGNVPNARMPSAEQKTELVQPRAQPNTTVAPYRRRDGGRPGPPPIRGSFRHEVLPAPARRPNFPAMDWLSCWAIATNEQVAAGGRIVIAPTLGAAGIIPAVLRYVVEFVAISPEDEENLIMTFLLTAAAIGMLFKRGATISAAEGGCMAEVGTSCSMAAGAFAACMGASPEVIEQAAETAIEHNLGLTCDPVDGLVQAPCIERNAVGAVKAVVSANLALSSGGVHSISLDEAIHAARLTAADMHTKYKETSLSGLATTVKIPVAVPDC